MEFADEIVWRGDSRERFIQRAIERESWGNYNGHACLGKRLIEEVQNKLKEISENLNLYQLRNDSERVAPLALSGYVLVYQKEYFKNDQGLKAVRLLIIDVRKSY